MLNKVSVSRILILTFLALASTNASWAQFGRNKVQYDSFDWQVLNTKSFKLFYPKGYEHLVDFANVELEHGLEQLSDDFSYLPSDKLSIIIYPSRFDFQETNITSSILPEGVGGFTELMKNRVVVPFNGDFEDFRHVLVHELTHAFVFDFLYGNAPAGVLSLSRVFQLPLWMAEGLSEFESQGWDPEADMYMRDAVLNDYIMPPDQLDGFLVYKQGQSMFNYIAERWGRRKIGEMFAKGKVEITTDRVVKSSLGISIDDFYRDWKIWVRRKYFPQIDGHNIPNEIATAYTNHERDASYMNLMPVYNPKKEQIAFVSDRSDYADVYLLDVPTKLLRRIKKGERSGDAQSFHPLDGRFGFSPNGTLLAMSVKHGASDFLVLYDVRKRKNHRTIDLSKSGIREINSPCFSAQGDRIVFAALHQDGRRDLFICDTLGRNLERLTNDVADDIHPTFSPAGDFIAFSSDRDGEISDTISAFPKSFGRYNLYLLCLSEPKNLVQITDDGTDNKYPSFSPNGDRLIFTSQKNGVSNIYEYTFETSITLPLTDLTSGAYSPTFSPDGKKIAFAAFHHGGWDIFVTNLTDRELAHKNETNGQLKEFATAFEFPGAKMPEDFPDTAIALNDKMFVRGSLDKYANLEPKVDSSFVKKYKPSFSADIMMVNFGYSTYYGLSGSTVLMFSDALGDHQILFATDLSQNLDNSNFYLGYGYVKKRTDFFFTAYHYKNFFIDNFDRLFSDRLYGGTVSAQYPFSQFSRAEFSTGLLMVDRYFYDPPYDDTYSENLTISAGTVFDNSLWGYTGPITGTRARLDFEAIPKVFHNPKTYWALETDVRKYLHLGGGYSLALRFSGAYSGGKDAKTYYLGGTSQWLNYSTSRQDIYTISDIYLSKIVVPLRGFDYFEYHGNAYGLLNAEFRYPFVQYLSLGFPPMLIRGINGAIFADLGGVAAEPYASFVPMRDGRLSDLKMGYGIGVRSWVWLFALQYDLAWTTDLSNSTKKPRHYFSLGLEF